MQFAPPSGGGESDKPNPPDNMATAKKAPAKKAATPAAPKSAKPAVTKTAKPAVKAAAPKTTAAKAPATLKPIKDRFNKTSLAAHLAQVSGVEPKTVKAVVAALEATMLAALAKKGAGEFTLPGLVRVVAQQVPAKKQRKGIDPFTKQERVFAAKPASVKLKARFFKKVKDAAI